MTKTVRFNVNFALRKAFLFLLCAHGGLIFINLLLGASLWFSFINSLVLAISVFLWAHVRNAQAYFLVSHPAWLFSFTAYAFSFLNGNLVDTNLGAAETSANLTLLYQLACVCAGLVALLVSQLLAGPLPQRPSPHVASWLIRTKYFFLVVGILGVTLNVLASRIPTSMAIVEFLKNFFWFGMAIHVCERGRILPPDLIVLIWLSLALLTGVLLNERTPILEAVLFVGLASIFLARRKMKVRTAVFLYLGFSLLSTFSDVTLYVRSYGQAGSAGETINLYQSAITEPETLINALLPWRGREGAVSRDEASATYEIRYFRTGNHFLTRFVLLPQLDMLLPDVPTDQPVDWNEVKNIALSVLPNFGQEKDQIFSDRLTWKVGVRSENNVGRPMITAIGELYFMGGALFCFAALTLIFSALYVEIMLLARVIGHPVVSTLVIGQFLVYAILTTTTISLVAVVVRTMPFFIILLTVLRAALKKTSLQDQSSPKPQLTRTMGHEGSWEVEG